MTALRSALYFFYQLLLTPPVLVLMILSMPFGYPAMHGLTRLWCGMMLAGVRTICGIDYRIQGAENLAHGAAVVLSKHQSAWETIFLNWYCTRPVFVIKRELKLVPVFGWGLAMVKPISIDRSAGRDALNQVIEQGTERLRDGHSVVIFPEGTRVAIGTRKRYGIGGASLAVAAGAPVIPVAHNAGYVWARNAFKKKPGLVTISFGPPIAAQNRTPVEVIQATEAWIEAEVARLGSGAREATPVSA